MLEDLFVKGFTVTHTDKNGEVRKATETEEAAILSKVMADTQKVQPVFTTEIDNIKMAVITFARSVKSDIDAIIRYREKVDTIFNGTEIKKEEPIINPLDESLITHENEPTRFPVYSFFNILSNYRDIYRYEQQKLFESISRLV